MGQNNCEGVVIFLFFTLSYSTLSDAGSTEINVMQIVSKINTTKHYNSEQ